jgi:hypothetical protein
MPESPAGALDQGSSSSMGRMLSGGSSATIGSVAASILRPATTRAPGCDTAAGALAAGARRFRAGFAARAVLRLGVRASFVRGAFVCGAARRFRGAAFLGFLGAAFFALTFRFFAMTCSLLTDVRLRRSHPPGTMLIG